MVRFSIGRFLFCLDQRCVSLALLVVSRSLRWIRRIRFPINISPNASLFFSNLQCAKRMMRANAGRHHGETVGLFSRDLSHVWMIDCSGSFSTSLSFIVRAFDLLEKKHTKTLEDSLSLSSFDQKMHFFPSPAAKKTSKKPTKRSGIPGKVLTTRITNQTRKVTTCSKAPAKRKSYCWL